MISIINISKIQKIFKRDFCLRDSAFRIRFGIFVKRSKKQKTEHSDCHFINTETDAREHS